MTEAPPRVCSECGRESERSRLKGLCYDCAKDCPHAAAVIGKVRLASGAIQVKRRCVRCGNHLGNVPNAGVAIDELPWLGDAVSSVACARCGATKGVEHHHWAPQSVFGDEADEWPTAPLCRDCHAEWHRRIAR